MTARVASRDLLSAGRLWLPALRALEARAPKQVDDVCAHAGIARAAIEDPRSRVLLAAATKLLRSASTATKDPLFALLAGRRHARESIDLFMKMLLAQPDFEAAMDTARRFSSLPIEGLEVAYVPEGPTLRVVTTLQGAPIEDPLLAEYVVGIIAQLTEDAGDARFRLLEVELVHAPRADRRAYRAALGAEVRFERSRTAVVLPNVNIPLRDADPLLATLLADHAKATLEALPSTRTFRGRVETVLASRLDDAGLGIDDAAAVLRMSGRTLRRRLDAESTTFGEVLDELRRQRALELLVDPNRSVTEVATAVGFSSPGAFRRAFVRWTGTNATAHRARGDD